MESDREGGAIGDDAPEADVAEQLTPVVDAGEDDTWQAALADARDREANEADLIEQAIAVPDDDSEFER